MRPARAPFEVDWVSGACMMVRRAAIDDAGVLDPGYFFMWEDADWCYRLKRAGWRVYCYHEAHVMHREGSSRNRGWRALRLSTVGFHRGAYRYYRKNINGRSFDPTHLVVAAGLAARTTIVLLARSFQHLRRVPIDRHREDLGPSVHGRPSLTDDRD